MVEAGHKPPFEIKIDTACGSVLIHVANLTAASAFFEPLSTTVADPPMSAPPGRSGHSGSGATAHLPFPLDTFWAMSAVSQMP